MKMLITVVFLTCSFTGAWAFACNMTDEDYAAVAEGTAHYSRTDLEALSPGAQNHVCKARALVRRINASPNKSPAEIAKTLGPDDMPIGLLKYTSPNEYKIAGQVSTYVLARAMRERGLVK